MRILQEHSWPGNVRELRNLVESMVVLAPGRRIEAQDIPGEVRYPRSRGILPAPISRSVPQFGEAGRGAIRPELEFVFRTLVNLRMDIDDLRKDFERFREEGGFDDGGLRTFGGIEVPIPPPPGRIWPEGPGGGIPGEEALESSGGAGTEVLSFAGDGSSSESGGAPDDASGQEEGLVVYRPGMTMEEMEKEAIVLALREVGGNRRKAAEQLEIGERTLYRKIKKYGLDD
jgi:DNA-binding NtrC family response regulator